MEDEKLAVILAAPRWLRRTMVIFTTPIAVIWGFSFTLVKETGNAFRYAYLRGSEEAEMGRHYWRI